MYTYFKLFDWYGSSPTSVVIEKCNTNTGKWETLKDKTVTVNQARDFIVRGYSKYEKSDGKETTAGYSEKMVEFGNTKFDITSKYSYASCKFDSKTSKFNCSTSSNLTCTKK